MNEFLTLATIVRTRGLKGEVVADFYTDFPERFEALETVRLEKPGHSSRQELESYWFQKGRIIIKFRGIDNPEAAGELVGCEVRIPEDSRFSLPEDHFYDSDLTGCRVIQHGTLIGRVKGVFRPGGGVSNLVVANDEGLEFMVPLVSEFCLSVNVEGKEIEVDLPPGLLDLASPE